MLNCLELQTLNKPAIASREAQWCETNAVLAFRDGKLLREEIQK